MQLGNYVLCVKSSFMHQGHHELPNSLNSNSTWPDSGSFDLRHHAVLETWTVPLSAADNISGQFGPRSGPTKCLMFIFITKIVSMIRKYHNHKPQTTLWHHEEEPLNHHWTPGRQIK